MSEWVKVSDTRWRLVSEGPATPTRAGKKRGGKDEAHVSGTLPRWCPGAKEYVDKPGHPDHGKPIVRGIRDIRNIEAATGFRHDRASSDQSYGWSIQSQFPERDD